MLKHGGPLLDGRQRKKVAEVTLSTCAVVAGHRGAHKRNQLRDLELILLVGENRSGVGGSVRIRDVAQFEILSLGQHGHVGAIHIIHHCLTSIRLRSNRSFVHWESNSLVKSMLSHQARELVK